MWSEVVEERLVLPEPKWYCVWSIHGMGVDKNKVPIGCHYTIENGWKEIVKECTKPHPRYFP